MLGYHFLQSSGKLRDETEPPLDGVKLVYDGELKP